MREVFDGDTIFKTTSLVDTAPVGFGRAALHCLVGYFTLRAGMSKTTRKLLLYVTFTVFMLCIGTALLLWRAIFRNTPRFVGDVCYGPEVVISEFMREYGGLPREDVDLLNVPDNLQVDPVASWEVRQIEVRSYRKLWEWLVYGSGAYGIKAEIQVDYRDGTQRRLLWDSWRYGLAYGNLVICRGDGPPGYINVIDLRE